MVGKVEEACDFGEEEVCTLGTLALARSGSPGAGLCYLLGSANPSEPWAGSQHPADDNFVVETQGDSTSSSHTLALVLQMTCASKVPPDGSANLTIVDRDPIRENSLMVPAQPDGVENRKRSSDKKLPVTTRLCYAGCGEVARMLAECSKGQAK